MGGNINSINGVAGNDTIVGPAATNNEVCTFNVNITNGQMNSGSEFIGSFSNVENLTGGAMTGTGSTDFIYSGSAIGGTVKGGTIRDRVDVAPIGGARIDLQAR